MKTWTPKEDQILFIKADALAELDVEVLAGVFNLEKAVIPQRIIEVDDFGGMGNNVVALLVDKNILNIYDKDVFADTQHNADGAFDNHFLHVHQIYFMDHFSNAIRFVTSGAGVLIDPTITEGSEVTSMEIKSSSGVARTYIKAYSGDTITLTAKVPSGTTTSKVTVTGYSSATVSVASGVASISLTYDPTVNSGKVEIVVAN